MPEVLIVEDDIDLNWTVCRILNSHGYTTLATYNSEDALRMLRDQHLDLILMDVQLPGANGYRLARHVRASGDNGDTPIIFMTVNSDLESKVMGFASGADDYLIKPFDMRELLVRIQAVLRRTLGESFRGDLQDSPERQLQVGDLLLNMDTATVTGANGPQLLTPTELQLLRHFMQNSGKILSSRHLLTTVWSGNADTHDNTAVLRWHIKNLRQKLEEDPTDPVYLRTIGHHGYLLSGGDT